MAMRIRATAGAFSFIVASSLNPAYFTGCTHSDSPDSPDFKYGAAEMTTLARAAADSFEFNGGGFRYRLDLDLEPAKTSAATVRDMPALFTARAYACGERKLFATASACIDSSSMDVQGTFALLRVQAGKADEVVLENEPVQGQLKVYSLILSGGAIELTYSGGHLHLNSKDAKSFELEAFWADGIGDDGLPLVYPE
jgi:hypothetical protein